MSERSVGTLLADRSVDADLRIRTAAVLLFARRGYAATGVRDIARLVGLTNAAIYHHVSSKEELLADIMRAGQNRLIASTRRGLRGVVRPEDALAILISSLTATHGLHRMVTRVMDGELRSLTPGSAAYQEIIALRDAYEDEWRRVLARGVEEGVFRIGDPRLTRLGLMAMCTGTSEWYRPGGPAALERVCLEFVEMGLRAVRARRDGVPVTAGDTPPPDLSLVPPLPWEPPWDEAADLAG
ncbi:AcrR family transcriptional regulator [Thermocatellispora tengchongensis]|uniref:AcrR family transcriptional regulator n=1 Tax=Thermocatellispora tengchongensis TaxID=1073253 RepID=A0A840P883_9ACTN|nr:TetR/AcrR family transcriptional regulator [Thermocatellispora tengchongensis]MBB5135878.1 AcrR family transcriptional regulator [Thermocatellispora tengchongensis]